LESITGKSQSVGEHTERARADQKRAGKYHNRGKQKKKEEEEEEEEEKEEEEETTKEEEQKKKKKKKKKIMAPLLLLQPWLPLHRLRSPAAAASASASAAACPLPLRRRCFSSFCFPCTDPAAPIRLRSPAPVCTPDPPVMFLPQP
jgi:chromatin remodeling complex protein RSC6